MSVLSALGTRSNVQGPADGGAELAVEGLTVLRGPLPAVRDVTIDVPAAGALGILGRNGAGKTTLLEGIMGLLPTTGRVSLAGDEIGGMPAWRRARTGLALVPQGRQLLADLTVDENLRLARLEPCGTGPEFAIDEMFPAIAKLRKRKAGYLSGGEQQQVAIARALLRRPTVLLLDEPTEGLAPSVIDHIATVLKTLRDRGLTFVLAEQHHHVVGDLCTSLLVLRGGDVAAYERQISGAALEQYSRTL
jgi:ABC-type branched-subunit amino acid transport system ATPase component